MNSYSGVFEPLLSAERGLEDISRRVQEPGAELEALIAG
jgi:hypothetical protein